MHARVIFLRSQTRRVLSLLVLLFVLSGLFAFDIAITEKAIEGYLRYEDNRNYGYWYDASFVGEIQLNHLTVRSGFLFGDMQYSNELKAFASAKVTPTRKIDFHLYWIYNGLPELDVYENSILPTITYNWSKRSFSLGYNTRYTTFWGKETIKENALTYAYRSDFLKKDNLQMSFILSNYSEFKVNAVTGLTYHLVANMPLQTKTRRALSLQFGVELLQSGMMNFVEDVYGVSIKTGIRVGM